MHFRSAVLMVVLMCICKHGVEGPATRRRRRSLPSRRIYKLNILDVVGTLLCWCCRQRLRPDVRSLVLCVDRARAPLPALHTHAHVWMDVSCSMYICIHMYIHIVHQSVCIFIMCVRVCDNATQRRQRRASTHGSLSAEGSIVPLLIKLTFGAITLTGFVHRPIATQTRNAHARVIRNVCGGYIITLFILLLVISKYKQSNDAD